MAAKPLPSQEALRQLFHYDPDVGELRWRQRGSEHFRDHILSADHAAAIWNAKNAGRIACGTPHCNGYRFGRLNGGNYFAHRIIWKWWHGFEANRVDHINGDKADNRIANLRDVTAGGNAKNMPLPRHNTSGEVGIHKCNFTGRWRASFTSNHKVHRLGRFDTIEEAVAARNAAMANHGFHQNHGRKE